MNKMYSYLRYSSLSLCETQKSRMSHSYSLGPHILSIV